MSKPFPFDYVSQLYGNTIVFVAISALHRAWRIKAKTVGEIRKTTFSQRSFACASFNTNIQPSVKPLKQR